MRPESAERNGGECAPWRTGGRVQLRQRPCRPCLQTGPDPRLRILVPLVNQVYPVGSIVQLVGTADYPQAERYQVDARFVGGDRWNTVARFRHDIRLGQLAQWNTEQLPAGNYELRLIPVDSNNIKLAESAACTVPLTLTPASPG